MQESVLSFDDVSKIYGSEQMGRRRVLDRISVDVAGGSTIAIVGRSGSGKSTFLHLAAGIDLPSEGRVAIHGRDLAGLSERQRAILRRDTVGLIFQFFHLLPHLSVYENVILPALIAGLGAGNVDARAMSLLERVDLADRAHDTVRKLSGGEMQRVAICRALLRQPTLLLADEPTGNLDDDNSRIVMELMLDMVREAGSTLLYVTHSTELAAMADATWQLHSGLLEQ